LSKTRKTGEGKTEDDDKVMFYDDWWWEGDKVWHCIVAGEDWVKKPTDMSRWYKSLPYTISMGVSTPSASPDQMGLSLLAAMQPNVELQEDLTSRIMTAITYYADPTIIAESEGAEIKFDKALGETVNLRPGQKLSVLQGPTVSSDVYQMLNHVNGAVQRSSLPGISYGQGLSGLSGYAISLMGQGGQMKMVLPVLNMETALSIVMDKCLDLLRNFSEDKDIFTYGQDKTGKMFSVKIKGSELKGFRVDVKLKPRIPQDEVARANRARLLTGVVSNRFIKDSILELQDPVADDFRQRVEQFMQDPIIRATATAQAAAEWGAGPTEIAMYLQANLPMLRQTQGPPQGPPGMGNAGPPPAPPGAQVAPSSPDELAQMQMMAAAGGNMPTPEGLAGMSMGGVQGGGY
jgi:hypothetical protein